MTRDRLALGLGLLLALAFYAAVLRVSVLLDPTPAPIVHVPTEAHP